MDMMDKNRAVRYSCWHLHPLYRVLCDFIWGYYGTENIHLAETDPWNRPFMTYIPRMIDFLGRVAAGNISNISRQLTMIHERIPDRIGMATIVLAEIYGGEFGPYKAAWLLEQDTYTVLEFIVELLETNNQIFDAIDYVRGISILKKSNQWRYIRYPVHVRYPSLVNTRECFHCYEHMPLWEEERKQLETDEQWKRQEGRNG